MMYRIVRKDLSTPDYDKRLRTEICCSCGKDYVFLSEPFESETPYIRITFECECGKQTSIAFPVN